MTQFASRVLNIDPEPYYVLGNGWVERISDPDDNESKHPPTWDPRPEYDVFTRNPVNRVLLHIRNNGWSRQSDDTKRILIDIHQHILKSHLDEHNGLEGYCRLTDETVEMIEHAQKVLERLARFRLTVRDSSE